MTEKIKSFIEEYQELDWDELEELYDDKANNEMTPEAGRAFMKALKVYKDTYGSCDTHDVLAVTDFEENAIVFLHGDGTGATDINGSDVFYIHPCSDVMAQCYALMHIMNENAEEDEYSALKNIANHTLHWFGDSLNGVTEEFPEEFEGFNITFFVYSEYGQCPWDPTLEHYST